MLAFVLLVLLLVVVVGMPVYGPRLADAWEVHRRPPDPELDQTYVQHVLGLPGTHRVPANWRWNPATIRAIEKDVFGDVEGFWFHPLPGDKDYPEALALNPHWPADKVPVAPAQVNAYKKKKHYSTCACGDCLARNYERQMTAYQQGFVTRDMIRLDYEKSMEQRMLDDMMVAHEEAVKTMAEGFGLGTGQSIELIPPTAPAPAKCRGCGKPMAMHVGYCDDCVRAEPLRPVPLKRPPPL